MMNEKERAMKRKFLKYFMVTCIVLSFSLSIATGTQAAKKKVYGEDESANMREMNIMQNNVDKEYRNKMLSTSKQSVALLKEIRDLLKQLNEKEAR
jgi:hypothetical protein